MSDCIFCKIARGEIPSKKIYEDEEIFAFHDINPVAPVHILIVTKREIPTVNDVTAEDEAALGRLFTAAAKIAAENDIAASGYRLIVNCNRDGGQEVFHIHMHLLGGRKLGPMLKQPD